MAGHLKEKKRKGQQVQSDRIQPREQGKTGLLIVALGPRSCEGCETGAGLFAVLGLQFYTPAGGRNDYCDTSAAPDFVGRCSSKTGLIQ